MQGFQLNHVSKGGPRSYVGVVHVLLNVCPIMLLYGQFVYTSCLHSAESAHMQL